MSLAAETYPLTRAYLSLSIFTLSLLGCASRPSPHRWLFFILIAPLTLYLILFTRTADVSFDYPVNLTLALNMFVMSDFLVLTDIQNVLRKKNQGASIRGAPFRQRMRWAFDLMAAYRGVGWEHEPITYLPISTKPVRSRSEFFVRQLHGLGKLALCYVICETALQVHPSFAKDGPPFRAQVWWLQPMVLAHGLGTMASMGLFYWVMGTVSVGVGLCDPNEWPPLFGHFSEMYSVQNFWGRVWHQAFRRFLAAHGTFVVHKLKVTNRTSRLFIRLFVAFVLSSLVHFLGDWVVCGWDSRAIVFFNIQPLGIALEMAFVCAVRRLGVRVPVQVARAVGYAWVVVWLALTFPICVEPLVRAGFLEGRPSPSVIMYLSRRLRACYGVSSVATE